MMMAPARPKNVLMIVVDSGRRDRFGCYGYERATTSAIDDLARESTVFEQMIAPASWTLPSHASLFTGLYPKEHEADYPTYRMRDGLLTLDRHLRSAGYTTVFLSNNPLVGKKTGIVDQESIVLHRSDFDPTSKRPFPRSVRTLLGRADRGSGAATSEALRLLMSLQSPFFLFINYMECHWRYLAPREFEARFVRGPYSWLDAARYRRRIRRRYSWENGRLTDPEEVALLSDLYDAALGCVDSRIGDLLEAVQQPPLRDETVVIVTSDHGEQIGDHGHSGHGMWLYNTLLHVPFIIHTPGAAPDHALGLAQFTDVFPALCVLLGLDVPAHLRDKPFSADPSMFVTKRPTRPYAFAEWHNTNGTDLSHRLARSRHKAPPDMESIQDERYKFVVQPSTGVETVYDLWSDPNEIQDRSIELTAERTRLADTLASWRETANPLGTRIQYSEQETQVLEGRLRDLGYM